LKIEDNIIEDNINIYVEHKNNGIIRNIVRPEGTWVNIFNYICCQIFGKLS
jgi:hypothetical protein